ncbi:MAG: hypothetical protein IJU23_05420 [Proteobacteria bacterium]|nr:hypothetical protein [Pseudomonadota bacterium]
MPEEEMSSECRGASDSSPAGSDADTVAKTSQDGKAASGNGLPGAAGAEVEGESEVPENLRVSRIVLVSIVTLFLFAVVTVILIPPLSWSPQKGVKSEFHAVSVAENVKNGAEPVVALAYKPFAVDGKRDVELKYSLHLKQTTYYEGVTSVSIDMETEVVINRPGRRHREEEVDIRLENVVIHLFDEKTEVPMSSTGAMIEGISVRALIEPKGGMSNVIPPATKINPQAARILFIVADALRQVFLPLPEGEIGENATWELRDAAGLDFIRRGRVTATEVSSKGAKLRTEFSLYKAGKADAEVGRGEISSIMSEGLVEESDIHYRRTHALFEGGASEQAMEMKFIRR